MKIMHDCTKFRGGSRGAIPVKNEFVLQKSVFSKKSVPNTLFKTKYVSKKTFFKKLYICQENIFFKTYVSKNMFQTNLCSWKIFRKTIFEKNEYIYILKNMF